MDLLTTRERVLLSVVSSALYTLGFPFMTHFLRGGGWFGCFAVVPLFFIAYSWGEWLGLFAAGVAIVYTDATLVAQYVIIQHESVSSPWVLLLFVFNLALLLLAPIVGRMGRTARAHRSSVAVFEAALKALPDTVLELDRQGKVHDVWHAGLRVPDSWPTEVSGIVVSAVAEAGEKGHSRRHTFSLTVEGKARWYELSMVAIGDHRGPDSRFIALARDITDLRILEQQLFQSQKMEAIGRLAGGVAHDFNNIIQVIIGFCDIVRANPGDRDEVLKHVNTIRDSALRAASLTQHLLAFSRKQTLSPRIVDVDASIEESLEMVRGMLGESITIVHESGGEASFVRVDPGQFTQVLTNLAINARDAMPFGGRLLIKVQRAAVASDDPLRPTEMLPGDYIVIQVSDTGAGMDQETLSHLFEPFFTTKGLGKGTGLGLSIVYGVVKQSAGHIQVDSTVGSGTTFSIYLPRVSGARETRGAHQSCQDQQHSGTETILLVEDEPQVSHLIQRCLSGCGYRVLSAGDGKTGLEICRQKSGQIHLLLVDLALPDITGDKVAREFRATNPRGRVVFMTGNSDVTGFAKERVLHKPFTLSDLAESIRQALDSQ